ncbi:hypothetical protein [Wenxinia saemankumensis]|uniref:Uncharacterized protein n=1 Tax=Wenxinia saemankumensis TaxID=1447782 RepID=A0A1M6HU70_9RHOB|nr:hypothetical protein [Wenxinia saemankumensis]SHJ25677.1 hypothetical protein SAMN05444417_3361 [Wenxinia saemankumensis]
MEQDSQDPTRVGDQVDEELQRKLREITAEETPERLRLLARHLQRLIDEADRTDG